MLEKVLKIVQKVLACMIMVCVMAVVFAADDQPASAASKSSRRLGGSSAALSKMPISSFGGGT